jgi:hypothetical protein
MAYVRRTQQLVESVVFKVADMKDAELQALYKRDDIDIGTPLYKEALKAALDSAWVEAPDLIDKMPDTWCRKENVLGIRFRGEGKTDYVAYTLETANDDKIKLPPSFSRWDTLEITHSHMTPLIKAWVDGRYESEKKKQSTIDLFGNISKQLTDFLESHASLNTALKEMPELELYVPAEYLDKIKEKTVKAAKKEVTTAEDLNIDVDALTRAAVAHRITSAGN